jgi:hypothetical protein
MIDDLTQNMINAAANKPSHYDSLLCSGWIMEWLARIFYARYDLEREDASGCLDSGLL